MKKIFILLSIVLCCSKAAAMCSYTGDPQRLAPTISPKVPMEAAVPVGSILYTKKYGTGALKTFTCSQQTNDQYIVSTTGTVVPGITGIQGKPVYATSVDGIGYQFSDILYSKNGALVPAETGSTLVPFERGNGDYPFITIWLIKTKPNIDTSNTSFNETITFSVGNMTTNPTANERLILSVNLKSGQINFKETSCDISVSGPKQVRLNKIEKTELMTVSQGGTTSAKKDIIMNVDCQSSSYGKTISYWFNPIGGVSAAGNGIINNMLTGSTAAKNVDIIIKKDNKPVVFYDLNNNYKLSKVTSQQQINLTADYYRNSNNANDITAGNVKAMMEVVIQED